MELSRNLAAARRARGLSQEELAALAGVSRQAVSKWETGDALPDLSKLATLCQSLGLSMDALCGTGAAPGCAAVDAAPKTDGTDGGAHAQVHRRRLPRPLIYGVLAIIFLLAGGLGGFWLGAAQPDRSAPSVQSAGAELPEVFSLSGVEFASSGGLLTYKFAPGVIREGLSFQITFSGFDGKAQTFDAPCSGGVCTGSISRLSQYESYSVTAVVGNGTESRTAPLATNLVFDSNGVSWTPAS